MEGGEKPHMDKYKEIINDWSYDGSCMLTSLGLGKFQALDFLLHRVYNWRKGQCKEGDASAITITPFA
jgi:hypothetical protein